MPAGVGDLGQHAAGHRGVEHGAAAVHGADRRLELARRHVLAEPAAGAGPHRRQDLVVGAEAGEHDDPRRRGQRQQPGQGGHAAAARHHQVEQHDVGQEARRPRRPRRRRRRPRPPPRARRASRGTSAGPRAPPGGRRRRGAGSASLIPPAPALAPMVPDPELGLDRQRAAEVGRPLAHRHEPEPAGADGVIGRDRSPRPSSATERVTTSPSARSSCTRHLVGAGVAHDVGDAPPGRCGTAPARCPCSTSPRRPASRRVAIPWVRPTTSRCLARLADQPVALEGGRPQLQDQRAQLGEDLLEQAASRRRCRRPRAAGGGRTATG